MSSIDRDKVQVPDLGRPHLFLLGAGASYAALPNGDKHGRRLPLMHNIVSVLGLEDILRRAGVDVQDENFETLYSRLVAEGEHPQCLAELEEAIFAYFSALKLPDDPCLYDRLLLSLRKKDVVATFNWDPFLVQALARCYPRGGGPRLHFLHGNTAIGYCMNHPRPSVGHAGNTCQQCGIPLTRSRLLYPVGQKNYDDDPLIKMFWDSLKRQLRHAYLFTIFGYGAPASDVEAVKLLQGAWGNADTRQFEEVEIIDIKSDDELHGTWKPFILSHHYRTTNSLNDSIALRHPRRSCEAMWAQIMEAKFIDQNPLPTAPSWPTLHTFVDDLVRDEEEWDATHRTV